MSNSSGALGPNTNLTTYLPPGVNPKCALSPNNSTFFSAPYNFSCAVPRYTVHGYAEFTRSNTNATLSSTLDPSSILQSCCNTVGNNSITLFSSVKGTLAGDQCYAYCIPNPETKDNQDKLESCLRSAGVTGNVTGTEPACAGGVAEYSVNAKGETLNRTQVTMPGSAVQTAKASWASMLVLGLVIVGTVI